MEGAAGFAGWQIFAGVASGALGFVALIFSGVRYVANRTVIRALEQLAIERRFRDTEKATGQALKVALNAHRRMDLEGWEPPDYTDLLFEPLPPEKE